MKKHTVLEIGVIYVIFQIFLFEEPFLDRTFHRNIALKTNFKNYPIRVAR